MTETIKTISKEQVLTLVHKPTGRRIALFVTRTTRKPRGRGAETPVKRIALASSRMQDNYMGQEHYISLLPDGCNLADFSLEVRDEY